MGGTAIGAEAPMAGAYVKRAAVRHRHSSHTARQLGARRQPGTQQRDSLICAAEQGVHLMDAKIIELKRHLRGGFAVGEIALEGIDAHAGSRARVVFQNEFCRSSAAAKSKYRCRISS